MSNAITDILELTRKSALNHTDKPFTTEQALQALYEAVKSAVPDEEMMQQKGDDLWTWNDCRAKFLTNLSLLFGVDLADSSKPKGGSK